MNGKIIPVTKYSSREMYGSWEMTENLFVNLRVCFISVCFFL
jgi:hypothetical protein